MMNEEKGTTRQLFPCVAPLLDCAELSCTPTQRRGRAHRAADDDLDRDPGAGVEADDASSSGVGDSAVDTLADAIAAVSLREGRAHTHEVCFGVDLEGPAAAWAAHIHAV